MPTPLRKGIHTPWPSIPLVWHAIRGALRGIYDGCMACTSPFMACLAPHIQGMHTLQTVLYTLHQGIPQADEHHPASPSAWSRGEVC